MVAADEFLGELLSRDRCLIDCILLTRNDNKHLSNNVVAGTFRMRVARYKTPHRNPVWIRSVSKSITDTPPKEHHERDETVATAVLPTISVNALRLTSSCWVIFLVLFVVLANSIQRFYENKYL